MRILLALGVLLIDVDPGLCPQSMDFVDTGYLMLANCDNGCRGALYVTFDGGQSWLARALPVSGTTQLRLDVVDARTVVLVTGETTDWYVSTDSGRTFASGGKGLPPPTQVQRGVMTAVWSRGASRRSSGRCGHSGTAR